METIAENKIFIRSIDLGHSLVRLRNDGIVQVNYGNDIELDFKESEEIVNAIGILTDGKKALIINVSGTNTTASGAARNHSASVEGAKYALADAFVTQSLPQKLLGNFYMNFHKPSAPSKIFANEEMAIEWLKSHL